MTDHSSPGAHLTPQQLDEVATRASADVDPDQADGTDVAAELEAHLAGCSQCRTALGDQIAVQGWLRRVPSPGPMPSDVVARLDAALAGARRDVSSSATVLPMRTDPPAGLMSRLAQSRAAKSLVAAAAVGLIGIGGYAAINHHDQAASTAGGSAASSAARPQGAGAANDQAARAIRASGTAYTSINLATEVTRQLADPTLNSKAFSGSGDAEATSALTTPAGLQSCVTALAGSPTTPLLVDLATYAGKPVAVIVLPGDGQGRQIWVVARTCAAGNEGVVYYRPLP